MGFPELSVVFLTPPPPAVFPPLHQLVQQSPDAVVLLRGAGYRFVTHGADAAHLKPLHQAPVQTNKKGNG